MYRSKESRPIRPFDEPRDAIADVGYRADLNVPFTSVKEHTIKVVDVDDLRVDAVHQFSVSIDKDELKKIYGDSHRQIGLHVLARDPFQKRVLTLGRFDLESETVQFALDRSQLESTSLRDEIVVDFVLGLKSAASLRPGHQNRKGSWVAKHRVALTREVAGPAIPFVKVPGEDFVKHGLGRDSGWYLKLGAGPESLLDECSELSAAFQVWVHEDIWTTLQEIGKTPQDKALGSIIASSVLSEIVSSGVQALVANESSDEPPHPSSPLMRCVRFVGKAHDLPAEELLTVFKRDPVAVMPMVWSALSTNQALRAADFRSDDR